MMNNSGYEIIPVYDAIVEHGEGPIWSEKEQSFLWVDLLKGTYYKGGLAASSCQKYGINQALGVMAERSKGGHVMAVRDGFGFFDEKTHAFQLIEPSPEQDNAAVRFNDGIVSPAGQFWAGTMTWNGQEPLGKLFRLNRDHSFNELEDGLFIPNGMGWNYKEDTFFMVDSGQNCVFAYNYDKENDGISNPRIHIQLSKDESPDGMAIDAEDNFWIAIWGGGKINRFDAAGNKVEEIELPVPYPTSCCFGGTNMDNLFVTTSKLVLDEMQQKQYPLSGSCFLIETRSKGRPEYLFSG